MLLIAYALHHAHCTFYATVTQQRRKPEYAADRLARIASQELFHDNQLFGPAPLVRLCTRVALRVVSD